MLWHFWGKDKSLFFKSVYSPWVSSRRIFRNVSLANCISLCISLSLSLSLWGFLSVCYRQNQLVLVYYHENKFRPEAVNLPYSRIESCSVSYNLKDQKEKNPKCSWWWEGELLGKDWVHYWGKDAVFTWYQQKRLL